VTTRTRPDAPTLRPASTDDLPACAAIWRDALNDYLVRLNVPAIPNELAPILRLHRHVHATDPDRFWIAERDGRPIGFVSAAERGRVWFLSMLFVRPDEQARGVGRALLDRILPDAASGSVLATATDSAQPISNALYSGYGMVPRMPLLGFIGYVTNPETLEPLPPGITAHSVDPAVGDGTESATAAGVQPTLDDLDREVVGFAHPADHRFLRADGRQAFVYRTENGDPAGYGYASAAGRVGPVVARDENLLAPLLGHLLRAVEPRGAFAVWAPGHAERAVLTLLRAGLRLDSFPVLLCWTEPFADFRRYLPISPGLL
jgi:GNAT superfamily N-acetyltransferase